MPALWNVRSASHDSVLKIQITHNENLKWSLINFFLSVSIIKGVSYKWNFNEKPLIIFASNPITPTSQINFQLKSARGSYITDVKLQMNPDYPSLRLSRCKKFIRGNLVDDDMVENYPHNSMGNNYIKFDKDGSDLIVTIGDTEIGS